MFEFANIKLKVANYECKRCYEKIKFLKVDTQQLQDDRSEN